MMTIKGRKFSQAHFAGLRGLRGRRSSCDKNCKIVPTFLSLHYHKKRVENTVFSAGKINQWRQIHKGWGWQKILILLLFWGWSPNNHQVGPHKSQGRCTPWVVVSSQLLLLLDKLNMARFWHMGAFLQKNTHISRQNMLQKSRSALLFFCELGD